MSESVSNGKAFGLTRARKSPSEASKSSPRSSRREKAAKLYVSGGKVATNLLPIPPELRPLALAVQAKEGELIAGRSMRNSPSSTPAEPIVLIPPDETRGLLRLGKERIRISRKRGITFVQVERAHDLHAIEILGGLGVLEALNLWAQGYKPNGGDPGTWFPQLWLGRSFYDDLSAKLRGKN